MKSNLNKQRFSSLVESDGFKGLFQEKDDLKRYEEIAEAIGVEEVDIVDFIGKKLSGFSHQKYAKRWPMTPLFLQELSVWENILITLAKT